MLAVPLPTQHATHVNASCCQIWPWSHYPGLRCRRSPDSPGAKARSRDARSGGPSKELETRRFHSPMGLSPHVLVALSTIAKTSPPPYVRTPRLWLQAYEAVSRTFVPRRARHRALRFDLRLRAA